MYRYTLCFYFLLSLGCSELEYETQGVDLNKVYQKIAIKRINATDISATIKFCYNGNADNCSGVILPDGHTITLENEELQVVTHARETIYTLNTNALPTDNILNFIWTADDGISYHNSIELPGVTLDITDTADTNFSRSQGVNLKLATPGMIGASWSAGIYQSGSSDNLITATASNNLDSTATVDSDQVIVNFSADTLNRFEVERSVRLGVYIHPINPSLPGVTSAGGDAKIMSGLELNFTLTH